MTRERVVNTWGVFSSEWFEVQHFITIGILKTDTNFVTFRLVRLVQVLRKRAQNGSGLSLMRINHDRTVTARKLSRLRSLLPSHQM